MAPPNMPERARVKGAGMQATLRRDVTLVGTGLHSGRPARLVLRSAEAGGIVFRRVDVTDRDNLIPARYDRVVDTTLCTVLANADGVAVSTVEHLMAALAGCGVHHALVDIDGPEVPIMDGSARRFVQAITATGLRSLGRPLSVIEILSPVRVELDGVRAELTPADQPSIEFEIDFPDAAIGRQARRLVMHDGTFARELADCRTFCRRADVEAMQARGLALGGSLDNAIVVEGDTVLNPGGFRRADECVRHKMLDAVGDLALAGAPILGAYRGVRAGHGPTNRLLRRLFETPSAWARVELDEEAARLLPGIGADASGLRRAG
jgi:UDP-3-O-[3-hydroxymyristoyl] N-acetylglucosamine deacetylase